MNLPKSMTVQPGQPGWRDRLLVLFCRRGWRGFLFLRRWLKPAGAGPGLRAVTRYGSQFFLMPGDEVDRRVLREGFYESEVLEAVLPFLDRDAVLWVVGANFGLHAITAKWLHPESRVVGFEPFPAMVTRLLENCDLNRLKIELHAYALGDQSGPASFFAASSGNPGMSTLHPADELAFDRHFCVSIQTAAEVIARGVARPPTALIVDAEGAELEVLHGFGAHLRDPGLRVVVVEAPNDFLTPGEPSVLREVLRSAGFSLQVLRRREDTAHALSNFVAIRP